MPIKYALFKNHLTPNPDDYSAIVQIVASWDLDVIADKIVGRGSTVGRADVMSVLEDSVSVCEEGVGESVHINYGGLMEFFPRIKGVFASATDPWDDARHYADAGAHPGSRVRDNVRANATVERVEAIKPAPNLVAFFDTSSGVLTLA